MSRASRKRSSAERKKRKQAAKAQKKALYASYADRRRAKTAGGVQAGQFNHAVSNCGNPGCKRCFKVGKAIR